MGFFQRNSCLFETEGTQQKKSRFRPGATLQASRAQISQLKLEVRSLPPLLYLTKHTQAQLFQPFLSLSRVEQLRPKLQRSLKHRGSISEHVKRCPGPRADGGEQKVKIHGAYDVVSIMSFSLLIIVVHIAAASLLRFPDAFPLFFLGMKLHLPRCFQGAYALLASSPSNHFQGQILLAWQCDLESFFSFSSRRNVASAVFSIGHHFGRRLGHFGVLFDSCWPNELVPCVSTKKLPQLVTGWCKIIFVLTFMRHQSYASTI